MAPSSLLNTNITVGGEAVLEATAGLCHHAGEVHAEQFQMKMMQGEAREVKYLHALAVSS